MSKSCVRTNTNISSTLIPPHRERVTTAPDTFALNTKVRAVLQEKRVVELLAKNIVAAIQTEIVRHLSQARKGDTIHVSGKLDDLGLVFEADVDASSGAVDFSLDVALDVAPAGEGEKKMTAVDVMEAINELRRITQSPLPYSSRPPGDLNPYTATWSNETKS